MSLTAVQEAGREMDTWTAISTLPAGIGRHQVVSRNEDKSTSMQYCAQAVENRQGRRKRMDKTFQLLCHTETRGVQEEESQNRSLQGIQMRCNIVECVYHGRTKRQDVPPFQPNFAKKFKLQQPRLWGCLCATHRTSRPIHHTEVTDHLNDRILSPCRGQLQYRTPV